MNKESTSGVESDVQINQFPSVAIRNSELPKYEPSESRRMMKNVIVVSLVFMLVFTASSSLANLQSSLNPEHGLGTYGRACASGVTILSSMFLPTLLIRNLTTKWTMVFAMIAPLLSISAQFYPAFSTIIPAAIISGILQPPLWAAKSTYLTHIGEQYAELVGQKSEDVINRFFGIFFFIFQTSKIWGNLIAATWVLKTEHSFATKDITQCGTNFCPVNAHRGDAILKPPMWQVYTLSGIYLGMASFAMLVAVLLIDSLQRYREQKNIANTSIMVRITATFRQLGSPMQIAVIPLTFWCGLQQGFYGADFYQAFVTCAWGVEKLGYVGICFGICSTLAAYSSSVAVSYVGRIPVFLLGAILNIGTITAMFNLQPDPNNIWLLFVFAGIWGASDSIWQTQISVFYGILFPDNKEAGFSNNRLWMSLGLFVAYINADLLCVSTKMHVLLGTLTLGILGYLLGESLLHMKAKKLIMIQK